MGKKRYLLPQRVIDKVRNDYTDAEDMVNGWGCDYLGRMARSYNGRYHDLDTQSRIYGKDGTWLYAQGEYLRLVGVQLEMLVEILDHNVPLWYCEIVFGLLHSEVYFVPVLKDEITLIITHGWFDHIRKIRDDESYPDGGTRHERVYRIMSMYPISYKRYFTITLPDRVEHGI